MGTLRGSDVGEALVGEHHLEYVLEDNRKHVTVIRTMRWWS